MKYLILIACLLSSPVWATNKSASKCLDELTAKLTASLGSGQRLKAENDERSIQVWIDAPIYEAKADGSERFVVSSLEAELEGEAKDRMSITWLNDDQPGARHTPLLLTYALAHAPQVREINVELPPDDLRLVIDQLAEDRRPSEAIVRTEIFRVIAAQGFGNLRDFKFEMEHEMIDPPLNLVITLARD